MSDKTCGECDWWPFIADDGFSYCTCNPQLCARSADDPACRHFKAKS